MGHQFVEWLDSDGKIQNTLCGSVFDAGRAMCREQIADGTEFTVCRTPPADSGTGRTPIGRGIVGGDIWEGTIVPFDWDLEY